MKSEKTLLQEAQEWKATQGLPETSSEEERKAKDKEGKTNKAILGFIILGFIGLAFIACASVTAILFKMAFLGGAG